MRRKQFVIIMLFLAFAMQLCGFASKSKTVMIDTNKYHVYEYVTVDTIISAFETEDGEAYKNQYVLLSGKIESIGKQGKSISIIGNKSTEQIECDIKNKNIRKEAQNLKEGETVAVFGMLTVDAIDKEKHLEVEKITKKPASITSTKLYYMLDEASFDFAASNKRELADGRITYYIPSKWKEIELNIEDEKLGIMEGYQYLLNKTPGNSDDVPETLFICYFKRDLLKEADDIRKTEQVERAIIENIEGKAEKSPRKKETTYFGAKYRYYHGDYKDMLDTKKNGYHTEYVFQEDGNNGMVMYLYVYREEKHISDIMFVTRFLEIKK